MFGRSADYSPTSFRLDWFTTRQLPTPESAEGSSWTAVTNVPHPANEPVNNYAPGSPERSRLRTKLTELAESPTDIRQVIGGIHRTAEGKRESVCSTTPSQFGARIVCGRNPLGRS